jgi:outer membrane receptor protein involved in Fe transport
MVWVRVGADKQPAVPVPNLPPLTANVKFDEFILTPEVGYRALDGEKFKIDALWGARYWHLGSNLQFTPSLPGFDFSKSANWADPLMGARFQAPLGHRVLLTVLGDAGGWGAGAQLDYQIAGVLGFKLTPKWTLDAGYRYLYVNYTPGNFVYQTAMSGALIGVSYSLK